jgi:hypothetical protein
MDQKLEEQKITDMVDFLRRSEWVEAKKPEAWAASLWEKRYGYYPGPGVRGEAKARIEKERKAEGNG